MVWIIVMMATLMVALQHSVLSTAVDISSLNLENLGSFIDMLDNAQLAEIVRETLDSLTTDKEFSSPEEGYSLKEIFMLEQLANGDSETVDEENPWSSMAAPPIPSIPVKSGLNSQCNNYACELVYRALSCQGMSVKLSRQCASHLVGAMYKCSNFPQNLYDAPSICGGEIKTFLTSLVTTVLTKGQAAAIKQLAGFVQEPNFNANSCERRCYHYYRQAANNLYSQCSNQLTTYKATYPFLVGIETFNQFRFQGCNTNATGSNCYVKFATMQKGPKSPIDVFNYKCKYGFDAFGVPDSAILSAIYDKFSKNLGGCCLASAMQVSQQNQLNTSNLVVWPPCLLSYFQSRGVALNELCSNNSIATQTTIQMTLTVSGVTETNHVLNTTYSPYNKTQILTLMGTLSGVLVKINSSFAGQPYNFNQNYPFQVMVTSGTVNGAGTSATYGLQFTVQNLNAHSAAYLVGVLKSPTMSAILSQQIFKASATLALTNAAVPYILTEANGVIPEATNSGSGGLRQGAWWLSLAGAFMAMMFAV